LVQMQAGVAEVFRISVVVLPGMGGRSGSALGPSTNMTWLHKHVWRLKQAFFTVKEGLGVGANAGVSGGGEAVSPGWAI
jgi:hypothetical protein